MRHRLPAALAVLVWRGVAASPARAQENDAAITVGDFLVRVAGALRLPAPAGGITPENAAALLRGAGIECDAAPTAPLTEAVAVKVMTDLGYRVVTGTPSRTVGAGRADLLIRTFIEAPEAPDPGP